MQPGLEVNEGKNLAVGWKTFFNVGEEGNGIRRSMQSRHLTMIGKSNYEFQCRAFSFR